MPLEVTQAEYLDGYRFIIWFNDGAVKLIDLSGFLYKAYLAPLRERNRIRHYQVELGTIVWEDEIDIAPEFLYNIAIDTLREGDRSQWEWGEPYSEEALRPRFEEPVRELTG